MAKTDGEAEDTRGWVARFLDTVVDADLTREDFLTSDEQQAIEEAKETVAAKKPIRSAALCDALRRAEYKIKRYNEESQRIRDAVGTRN